LARLTVEERPAGSVDRVGDVELVLPAADGLERVRFGDYASAR
jgi:hypothetical protein